MKVGLRFIGTIKTATKEYPMSYLGNKVLLHGRGDRHGVASKDPMTGASLLAFVWVDCDRRYFISSCSSLADGVPCSRMRWRQVNKAPNAPPELVNVVVPQPEACGLYYKACGKIDQHNRHRQGNLMIERKVKTTTWWRRVNMSIFAMCVVDAYLLMTGCQGVDSDFSTARDFFQVLAEQLIDNSYDERALRKRAAREAASRGAMRSLSNSCLSPSKQTISKTPTKSYKRKNMNHRHQG